MTLFNRGKFPLSADAMKAAARSLQADPHHPDRARIALRKALCVDARGGFDLFRRDGGKGTVTVNAPLTWVSGSAGSGKTELIHAAARQAARRGRRVVIITSDTSVCWRWMEQDRKILDLREGFPIGEGDIRANLRPILQDDGVISTIILVPHLARHPDHLDGFGDFCLAVARDLPNKSFFVIDEYFTHHLSPAPCDIRSDLVRADAFGLIGTQSKPQIGPHGIAPGDAYIAMRNVGEGSEENGLINLVEGEGFLSNGDERIPILGGYEFEPAPAPVMSEPASLVAFRLEERLTRDDVKKHIGRLEAVARACGYRSWHAAQGRRLTRTPDF